MNLEAILALEDGTWFRGKHEIVFGGNGLTPASDGMLLAGSRSTSEPADSAPKWASSPKACWPRSSAIAKYNSRSGCNCSSINTESTVYPSSSLPSIAAPSAASSLSLTAERTPPARPRPTIGARTPGQRGRSLRRPPGIRMSEHRRICATMPHHFGLAASDPAATLSGPVPSGSYLLASTGGQQQAPGPWKDSSWSALVLGPLS